MKDLLVDRLFRTMEGPSKSKLAVFPGVSKIWVTSFGSTAHRQSDQTPAPEFFCHSDIEFPDRRESKRSFFRSSLSVSPGNAEIRFPTGFALPLAVDSGLNFTAMVHNHTFENVSELVSVAMNLEYWTEKEAADKKLRALQILTPHVLCAVDAEGIGESCKASPNSVRLVGENERVTTTFTVGPGKHRIATTYAPDRFPQLGLKDTSRVHYIWVHVHPYATAIRFREKSGKVLWEGPIEQFSDRIAIQKSAHYSSTEGFPLDPQETYELEVDIDNTTDHAVDAMATMYLYVANETKI